MSDCVSKALAEASLPGEPRTYDAISKRSGVPPSTLYYRDHGRRSREEKAQGQQYLTPSEEKALEKYMKQMADMGNPVRIKYIPSPLVSLAGVPRRIERQKHRIRTGLKLSRSVIQY
jgi:hypothetical protein